MPEFCRKNIKCAQWCGDCLAENQGLIGTIQKLMDEHRKKTPSRKNVLNSKRKSQSKRMSMRLDNGHYTRFKNILVGDLCPCHYCGFLFTAKQITRDHKIPKSKGGRLTVKNTVPACHQCNSLKADMEYLAYLEWRLKSGYEICEKRRLEIEKYFRNQH